MSDFTKPPAGNPSNTPRWRVSEYQQSLNAEGAPAYTDTPQVSGSPSITMFGSTLMADLGRVHRSVDGSDILEVMATCLRHKENALIHLDDAGYVLPITIFPDQKLFHTSLLAEQWATLRWARLRFMDIQPAVLRPPGHVYTDRVAATERYGALGILLWFMALQGPRRELLSHIDARADYRLTAGPELQALPLAGALRPAVEHLRREATSLRTLSKLPGMDMERACRLLNALYLLSALMVLRSYSEVHASTAAQTGWAERIRSRWGGL